MKVYRRGGALLEIMIAVTLFALAGLALLELLPTVWLTAKASEQQTQAQLVARSLLELYRSDPQLTSGYAYAPVRASGTTYEPRLTISEVYTSRRGRLIRVDVHWRGAHNRQLSISQQLETCPLPR